jgi:hypothetical protein
MQVSVPMVGHDGPAGAWWLLSSPTGDAKTVGAVGTPTPLELGCNLLFPNPQITTVRTWMTLVNSVDKPRRLTRGPRVRCSG